MKLHPDFDKPEETGPLGLEPKRIQRVSVARSSGTGLIALVFTTLEGEEISFIVEDEQWLDGMEHSIQLTRQLMYRAGR